MSMSGNSNKVNLKFIQDHFIGFNINLKSIYTGLSANECWWKRIENIINTDALWSNLII